MREDAKTRARRLLVERRVMIAVVRPGAVLACVRGDSGEVREVRWDPRRGWACTCPAIGLCSHGHAVASVVVVPSDATGVISRPRGSSNEACRSCPWIDVPLVSLSLL